MTTDQQKLLDLHSLFLKKKLHCRKCSFSFTCGELVPHRVLFSLQQFLGTKWKNQAGPFESYLSWTSLQSSHNCSTFATNIFCSAVWTMCLTKQQNCWVPKKWNFQVEISEAFKISPVAAFTDGSCGDDCGTVEHWDAQEIQSCSVTVTA